MKYLIKQANIVDGSGAAAFVGDILIENKKIVAIEKNIEDASAEIIMAYGLTATPGFIDTHSHSDLAAILAPTLSAKIRQGITTELLGQDGIAPAPLPEKFISSWRKNLAGLDGDSDSIDWSYRDTSGYLKMLDQAHAATNLAYLVPHGNVRMEAMGLDDRPATAEEITTMKNIVRREMEAGAYGLSTGLIYIPCAYAITEELVELCKVVAEYSGAFVVHQRSEADDIINSTNEIIYIAEQSGANLHVSHIKVCGKNNWKNIDTMLSLLEAASRRGIQVSFDQYPYVAGSTMLGVILPPWAHAGGTDKLIERLADPEMRRAIERDIATGLPGWDNFVDFAGLEQIFVTSVLSEKNQGCVGMNLVQLGDFFAREPLDATMQLLMEENNAVGMVDFYGNEEHLIKFLTHPFQNVCTDGLMSPGKPHPRVYGAFPRVFGKYVREERALTLEQAVRKMSGRQADVFGFAERGYLRSGYFADVVLLDDKVIGDNGTYVAPEQFPSGIKYVFVNGAIAVKNDSETGVGAGMVLRRQ
ncbi:MAG: D-aminoacylase [Negativicutes bacterium]